MIRTLLLPLVIGTCLLVSACGSPHIIQADSHHVTIEGTGDDVRKLAKKHCARYSLTPKYLGQSREDVSEFDCVPSVK